jgi:glycosyltransferase involved in cell wall biosynthesis
MSGRRLLMVIQPTDGGSAECVLALTAAAVSNGWQVTVACPADGDLAQRCIAAGATWERCDLKRGINAADVGRAWKLRGLMRRNDVVHLHSSTAGAVGRLALLGMKAARPGSAFTPHGWSWDVGGALRPAYVLIERALAKVTDVVVAVSPLDADLGRQAVSRLDPRVIPNGVDKDEFSVDGEVAERAEAPLIVVIGRNAEQKGQDLAIRALARARHRTARLRLVGDGVEQLRPLAAELGVSDRVEYLPHQPPAAHLRAADLVLVPSRWDACSLVVLEALSTGAAVIATDVTGAAVALSHALRLVRVEDVEGMADAIDELLADDEQRSRLATAAPAAVTTEWTRESWIGRHLELWEELAGQPRAARS